MVKSVSLACLQLGSLPLVLNPVLPTQITITRTSRLTFLFLLMFFLVEGSNPEPETCWAHALPSQTSWFLKCFLLSKLFLNSLHEDSQYCSVSVGVFLTILCRSLVFLLSVFSFPWVSSFSTYILPHSLKQVAESPEKLTTQTLNGWT